MTEAKREYKYGGAKALVELHELHMRGFLETWRKAKAAGVALPDTSDPDYNSMEHVLCHTLGAAGHYMTWMCRVLELPEPGIDQVPGLDVIESAADGYLEHVLERWSGPLVDVVEDRFGPQTYLSSWNTHYCIDAMLEHAVMHPVRHSFQLKGLVARR